MSLQIRRLSYALGAEITGIDIGRPLDDKSFDELTAAFLEHIVLLFRGQALSQEQFIAFTRRFGELEINEPLLTGKNADPVNNDPLLKEIDLERPEIMTNKRPADAAQIWHIDRPSKCTPTKAPLKAIPAPMKATLFRAIEVPEVGGDTMFANQYLAYETLSDGMKKLIDSLEAIHLGSRSRIDHSTPERLAETTRLNPPVVQPLVRRHPETGRKSLFVEQIIPQIVGMTPEESKPLIRFLCNHATRPQFCYRHRWRNNDLLIWDNCCTLHMGLDDYDRTQLRHMERTQVWGTPSGYVYEGPPPAGAVAGY